MASQITISVDPDVAALYLSASESDRRKLDLLVSLHLRDAMRPERSLQEVMSKISRNARERGLTPELWQSIVNAE